MRALFGTKFAHSIFSPNIFGALPHPLALLGRIRSGGLWTGCTKGALNLKPLQGEPVCLAVIPFFLSCSFIFRQPSLLPLTVQEGRIIPGREYWPMNRRVMG